MVEERTGTPKKQPRWRAAFLAGLEETGNVTLACQAAKVGRTTVYRHREEVPDFASAWESSMQIAADLLEAEARRRAAEGVTEPVYQGGKLVGTIRKYSDTLLIFLLKGARPEVYRERYNVEHSGPGGGPIEVEDAREALMQEVDQLAERRSRRNAG